MSSFICEVCRKYISKFVVNCGRINVTEFEEISSFPRWNVSLYFLAIPLELGMCFMVLWQKCVYNFPYSFCFFILCFQKTFLFCLFINIKILMSSNVVHILMCPFYFSASLLLWSKASTWSHNVVSSAENWNNLSMFCYRKCGQTKEAGIFKYGFEQHWKNWKSGRSDFEKKNILPFHIRTLKLWLGVKEGGSH